MPRPDHTTRRRTVRRLRDGLEDRALVTWGLLVAMVSVHVGAGAWDHLHGKADGWGVLYGDRSKEAMIAFGGRSHELVAAGQLWRLVSCGFLHAGPIHLTVNALSLLGLGPLCEAVFGRVRTLALFLVSVVTGAVLSQVGPAPLAVGASGGAFGMMGALVAFGWTRRESLHPILRRMFGASLWPWVVLNLGMGVALPGIDNLGHVGGLVAGLAFGAVSPNRIVPNQAAGSDVGVRIGCALVLAYALVGAALSFP